MGQVKGSRLNDLAGYVDFFFADFLGVGKTGLGGDNGLPFFSWRWSIWGKCITIMGAGEMSCWGRWLLTFWVSSFFLNKVFLPHCSGGCRWYHLLIFLHIKMILFFFHCWLGRERQHSSYLLFQPSAILLLYFFQCCLYWASLSLWLLVCWTDCGEVAGLSTVPTRQLFSTYNDCYSFSINGNPIAHLIEMFMA